MASSELSDRELAILHNGDIPEEQTDDSEDVIVSKEMLVNLQAELAKAQATIREHEKRIQSLEEDTTSFDSDADDRLTIERYANIPKKEREELLSESERRAVAIFENWEDIAQKTQAGLVVSTKRSSMKKNHPSQFKLDLERVTGGKSLKWVQVYRAMKELARLSGGNEHKDEYDRLHIHGGAFEYHEKVTPDGENTYKVLQLRDENSLTAL